MEKTHTESERVNPASWGKIERKIGNAVQLALFCMIGPPENVFMLSLLDV